MNRKWTFVILLLLIGLIFSGCAAPVANAPASGESTDAEAAADNGTPKVLKVATTANITTWDPVKSFSTEALYMANLYEQLLRINPPDADGAIHAAAGRKLGSQRRRSDLDLQAARRRHLP